MFDTHSIALLLSKDVTAYEKRHQICGELGLEPYQYSHFGGSNSYEFFCDFLENWKAQGCGANAEALVEGLRRLGLNNAADNLTAPNFGVRREKPVRVWHGIREPVDSFTGRELELAKLHEFLSRNTGNDTPTVISQATTVSGLGGIGKSELARMYARKYHQHYDGNAVWINAETTLSISSSLLNVVKRLAIPSEKDSIQKLFEHLYTYFSDRKCLIILDNVEELDVLSMLPQCLPPYATKPCILITSRKDRWSIGIKVLSLPLLSLDEATEFIRKCLQKEAQTPNFTENQLQKLASTLQGLPLALQQAVAYIKYELAEDPDPIQKYLETYEGEKAKDLLKYENNLTLNENEEPTFYTWKVTLDRIADLSNGALAIRIIRLISYFDPIDIPTEIFQTYIKTADDVNAAINLLKSYSMVRGEAQKIKVHRLVQHVVRIEAEETGDIGFLRKAIGILKYRYDSESAAGGCSTPSFTGFDRHSTSVWTHVLKHPTLVKEFGDFPLYIFKTPATKPNHLQDRFRLARTSREALQLVLGLEHEYTIKVTLEEISALWGLRRFKEALEALKEVYTRAKVKLDKELSDLIQNRLSIGIMYSQQNYAELLEPYQELLQLQIEEDGEENVRTLNTLKMQASLFMRLSRLDDSLNLLNKIHKVYKKQNLQDHPDELCIRSTIADVLEEKGQLTEALAIYVEVHLATRKIYNAEQHQWRNTDSEKSVERCARKLTVSYFLSARRLSTSVVHSADCYVGLSQADAEHMVISSFPNLDLHSSFVSKLCNILDRLPIALDQAIAYIKTTGIFKAPELYLQRYHNHSRNNELEFMYETNHEKICSITWKLALKRLLENAYGGVAVKVMQLISYLDPDTSIPKSFISNKVEELEEAIELLQSYALITVHRNSMRVHYLTQTAVRSEYRTIGETALRILIQKLENPMTPYTRDDELVKSLLPHAVAVWKNALQYDSLVKEFPTFPFDICTKLGYFKQHNEMLNIASNAEQRLIMLLGKTHHATASLIEPMEAYRKKFDADQAVEIFGDLGDPPIYDSHIPRSQSTHF